MVGSHIRRVVVATRRVVVVIGAVGLWRRVEVQGDAEVATELAVYYRMQVAA